MHPEIKFVCFDLDQTLINENSWSELSLTLGVSKELDDELYRAFKAGEITYDEWNDRVLAEYMKHDDATRQGITTCFSKYTLADGAREAVEYVKKCRISSRAHFRINRCHGRSRSKRSRHSLCEGK